LCTSEGDLLQIPKKFCSSSWICSLVWLIFYQKQRKASTQQSQRHIKNALELHICASKFAPEGQLRLQLAPFLRTSRRTECSFVCHVPGPRGDSLDYFCPAGRRLNFFLRLRRQPISASPVLFHANEVWVTWLQCCGLYKHECSQAYEHPDASPLQTPYLARSKKDSIETHLLSEFGGGWGVLTAHPEPNSSPPCPTSNPLHR